MQVILGSGGSIGNALASELVQYTGKIRLASRNPIKINENDQTVVCNLINPVDVEDAVKGCEIAYLTAGLPYRLKIWQEQWPVVMKNTIEACKKYKVKLVFFDNVYMYHKDKLNPMTEETEIFPESEKGKVRAAIVKMLMNEINNGKLEAMITRAADFYGPGIKNSFFNQMVTGNLKKGKKANWLCSLDYLHNFTFTPDAAKAVAMLGNTDGAYGQVWHLPTAQPLTGKQWIELVASELNVKPKVQVASKPMVRFIGIFNPLMKEFFEMMYQWDRDYNFDSSKFETVFKMKPTPVNEAVRQIIDTK